MGTMVDPVHGKLAANWEGPYLVTDKTGTGAYFLKDEEGRDIQNSWIVSNLRVYYHWNFYKATAKGLLSLPKDLYLMENHSVPITYVNQSPPSGANARLGKPKQYAW